MNDTNRFTKGCLELKTFFFNLFLLKTNVSYSRGTKPFGLTRQNMNKDLDQGSLVRGTKVSSGRQSKTMPSD